MQFRLRFSSVHQTSPFCRQMRVSTSRCNNSAIKKNAFSLIDVPVIIQIGWVWHTLWHSQKELCSIGARYFVAFHVRDWRLFFGRHVPTSDFPKAFTTRVHLNGFRPANTLCRRRWLIQPHVCRTNPFTRCELHPVVHPFFTNVLDTATTNVLDSNKLTHWAIFQILDCFVRRTHWFFQHFDSQVCRRIHPRILLKIQCIQRRVA